MVAVAYSVSKTYHGSNYDRVHSGQMEKSDFLHLEICKSLKRNLQDF